MATIAAARYSNNHLDYYTYDNLPLNGTGYYRIKQVDKDGRFQVSVGRSISFDMGDMVTITPNPARDFITITLDKNNSTNTLIQFFNTAGNIVYTKKTNPTKININTSRLARGLYFIKIINTDRSTMQKLLLH